MSSSNRVEALDSTLLAKRAHTALLDAITQGRFQDRLPNEPDLAAMLNISRTTLRVALQALEKDGIITRRRALGTTINRHISPSALAIQRLVGFEQLLLEGREGATVEVEEPRWTRGPVPEVFVATFDLPPDLEALLSEKKYLVNGRVALWVRDVVPTANVKGDVNLATLTHSLLAFSEQYCEKPIDHALAQIAAVVASDEGGGNTALEMPPGAPFVQLRETFYSADATVIAYGILDFDDATKLEIFRRRD